MKETKSTGKLGILTVLLVVFIVLKLVGTITWSWWWIIAPMWIPFALVAIFLLGAACVALIGMRDK